MRPTKTLTALLAAGAITASGIALAPAALAAVTDSGSSDSSSTSTDRGPGGHGGPGGPALQAVLDTLGITEADLTAARDAGQSLADLAAAQGVETQSLIDALIADAEEHLAEHVADGDLTQAEADERLAELTERITERVEQPIGAGHEGRGGHGGPGGPGVTTILATLSITEEDLVAARDAGQSLADLAAAQGVETQTLIDALVADAEEHLAEEVADGDLTQAEADERLAELTERITERVEQPIGAGHEGRGGHGGPGGPGGHDEREG